MLGSVQHTIWVNPWLIKLPENLSPTHVAVVSKEKARKNIVHMKILGDVRLHMRLSNLTLPRIKVALECDIDFNYIEFALEDQLFVMKKVQDHIGEMMVKVGLWCTNAQGKRKELLTLTKIKEKKGGKGVVVTVVLLPALRVSVDCG
ncbi:hypothetical protein NC652_008496 [Populus alba x Populus x berolinensis]|nr:hypothetical protein NC652_008496 [Populus alba x Populus x berolinensis]